MTVITSRALAPRSTTTTETRLEASHRALLAAANAAGIDPKSYTTRVFREGERGGKVLAKGDEIQIRTTEMTNRAVKDAFNALFDASKFTARMAPEYYGVRITTRVDKNRVSYIFVLQTVEGPRNNSSVDYPVGWVPPR